MYYTRSDQHKTDEQYNFDKRKKQEKTDLILDKISKSGYDSLTRRKKISFLIKVKMDSSEKLRSYSLGAVIGMNILFSLHLLLSYTAHMSIRKRLLLFLFWFNLSHRFNYESGVYNGMGYS